VRKHLHYIDYLRFFAMTFVVYVHVAGVVIRKGLVPFGGLDWELLNLLEPFGYATVATFLMISGYLLLSDSKSLDLELLLKKRLPRLGIPLLVWTAVAAVWISHLADDYSIGGIAGLFLKGIYGPIMEHFWFMFTLIALYAVSPLLYGALNTLDKKGRVFVLILIGMINLRYILVCFLPAEAAGYLSFQVLDKIEPTGGVLSVFILGWYLGRSERKIPNLLLALGGLLCLLIIALGTRTGYLRSGVYESPLHRVTLGFEPLLAACVFLLFKQNVKKPGRLFELLPIIPLCFPIYLMHVISMELFFGLGWQPKSFAATALFVLANLAFCYVVTKTAASIKPLCYMVTGMKFSEACRSCNWQYSLKRIREGRKETVNG